MTSPRPSLVAPPVGPDARCRATSTGKPFEFFDDEAQAERDAAEVDAMSDEEVRAELLRDGIDPDAAYEELRARLLLRGVNLPPAVRRPRGEA